MDLKPCRGELWIADLEPMKGHEQGGKRPCLVLSDDEFNYGPAELLVVLPITSRDRGILLHIRVEPPEGGVKTASYIMPEMIRSISRRRLSKRLGRISAETLAIVEAHLRILLRMA